MENESPNHSEINNTSRTEQANQSHEPSLKPIQEQRKSLFGKIAHMLGHSQRGQEETQDFSIPTNDFSTNLSPEDMVESIEQSVPEQPEKLLSTDPVLSSSRRRIHYLEEFEEVRKNTSTDNLQEKTLGSIESESPDSTSNFSSTMSRRRFLQGAIGVTGALALRSLPETAEAHGSATYMVKPDELTRNLEGIDGPTGNFYFDRVWKLSDGPIATGSVRKPWTWGPKALTKIIEEPYSDSPNGKRQVVYFDKSRMEINNPDRNPDSNWYVTNGLLPLEMIKGKIQTGNNEFEDRKPAEINIVGDLDDSHGVTYASLHNKLDPVEKIHEGTKVTSHINRAGEVSQVENVSHEVSISSYDEITGHNIAGPFEEYINNRDHDPLKEIGRPITEPYWVEANVGGTPKKILMQVFERRCLTYDPTNPSDWQVEAGNVGKQYHTWRYDSEPQDNNHENLLLTESNKHMNNVLKEVLQNKDLLFFNQNFVNSLPEHYTQEIKDKRWWMGAYLTNAGIIYGVNSEFDKANETIKKSWQYSKELISLNGNSLPDNTSTEVFPMLEFILALKLHGNELQKREPNMVDEILNRLTAMADNYASQPPKGNSEDNIRENSFGETNAGIAAQLIGAASLLSNHPNREQWIASAHKYAKATFALGTTEDDGLRTVILDSNGDIEFYNHGIISDHYLATSLGLLGEAKLFAKMGNIDVGEEFSHNVDLARRSFINHIDDNFKYTRPEYKAYGYYDEYGLGAEHQDWDGYAPVDFFDRKVKRYTSNFHLRDKEINPSYGPLSSAFLDSVDPAFRDDMEAYFGSINYMRIIVQSLQTDYQLDQSLKIADKPISLFTKQIN